MREYSELLLLKEFIKKINKLSAQDYEHEQLIYFYI